MSYLIEKDLEQMNRSLLSALAHAQENEHAVDERNRMLSGISSEAEHLLVTLLLETGQERMDSGIRRVLIQVRERLQRIQRIK